VKLPAQRAGLPGKVISFCIVSLAPAYKAGFAGHVPATNSELSFYRFSAFSEPFLKYFETCFSKFLECYLFDRVSEFIVEKGESLVGRGKPDEGNICRLIRFQFPSGMS
jgi:hypothetical protein